MGLYLGADPVDLPGVSAVYLGGDKVWPSVSADPGVLAATFTTKTNGQTSTLWMEIDGDIEVDWGDGTVETLSPAPFEQLNGRNHTYTTSGTYHATFTFPGGVHLSHLGYASQTSSQMASLISIDQWDAALGTTDCSQAFRNSANFVATVPPPPTVTQMTEMFNNATVFNQDIGDWDVSRVTNMSSMFYGASVFNQNIGGWDVSSATNMDAMFMSTRFNQDIGNWDVSNVKSMNSMFCSASAFNQDIGGWNTANVTDMNSMFYSASAFNQDISGWNTSRVIDMSSMFARLNVFNQDLSRWDVSSVTNMSSMFYYAKGFNQDISGWNTANVKNMNSMFNSATAFNQDIGGWNTSRVTNMGDMFRSALAFNQDISGWNVAAVTGSRPPSGFNDSANPDWVANAAWQPQW